jgi:hypothetical protein
MFGAGGRAESDVNAHTFLRFGALSAGLVLTAAAIAADGTVIYDSTSNRSDRWVGNLSPIDGRQIEIGDEISLAGSARVVTSFVFEYFGDITPGTAPGANAVLRFYANDGPLHIPSSGPAAAMPRTLLWESQPIQVLGKKEFREVTISVPDIVVPNKITWSIQFNGLTGAAGSQAGLTISDPVTIGAVLPTSDGTFLLGSHSDYWGKTDPLRADSWALFIIPPNRANFHAKVTAVPEPGTVALITLGGIAALVGRRPRNG